MQSILKNSLLFLSGSILLACGGPAQPETPETPPVQQESRPEGEAKTVELTADQARNIGLEMDTIRRMNLNDVIRVNGYTKLPPQNIASVSVYQAGVVTRILVKEDDYVKKGQVLATLEHPDFTRLQESYLTTRSQLNFLEQEYERQRILQQENVNAAKVFQQTQADYQAEKATLASLKNQLQMLGIPVGSVEKGTIVTSVSLRSPIPGNVSRILVNTGTLAQPGSPLFEVIDNRHIHLDLLVYEKDLFKVKPGQKINFVLTNQIQQQQEMEAKVFAVGKAFENDTKSVAIHGEIDQNEKYGLIPGMYVSALIDVGQQTVTAVPAEAVVKSEGKEFIFLQAAPHEEQKEAHPAGETHEEGEKEAHGATLNFAMVEVKTGTADLGYVQIQPINPVPAGALVVTKGAFFLQSQLANAEGGDEGHGH